LLWSEQDKKGEYRPIIWHIETDQERADADRFYQIATWRRWSTPKELHELVRNPGPWLLRWNSNGLFGFQFRFLRTADWDWLFGPGSDDRIIVSKEPGEPDVVFTDDPSQAVRITSAQVLALIPEFIKQYGLGDEVWDYFEPILPAEPYRDFRAEQFALKKAKVLPTN
jgi:hypothetical protein